MDKTKPKKLSKKQIAEDKLTNGEIKRSHTVEKEKLVLKVVYQKKINDDELIKMIKDKLHLMSIDDAPNGDVEKCIDSFEPQSDFEQSETFTLSENKNGKVVAKLQVKTIIQDEDDVARFLSECKAK